MERQHQPGDIIAQRYRILGVLGQGGMGITYAAEDLQMSEQVALKAVSLRRLDDFKVLELFEREVRILAQLNHPNIPRYLDYFQVDKRRDRFFYLVQQLAEGHSLSALVEKGWHPDEAEVRHIATQILESLVYLQQLTPPVIHRDIKPQNLIRRQDGRVFLVDFGAVQDVYHNTLTGGSTVVGTYGYMAPEQFRGQAVLATDLYALGVTLLYLLTRKDPTDLPQRKLKIDFRPHVRVAKQFTNWLERMIEPVAEDRFSSAEEALAVLRGEKEFTYSATTKPPRPANSPITLMNQEKQLIVEIPPIWLRSDSSKLFALLPLAWNGFFVLIAWLSPEFRFLFPSFFVHLLYFFFSPNFPKSQILKYILYEFEYIENSFNLSPFDLLLLCFCMLFGLWMLGAFLVSAVFRIKLVIDQHNFQLQRYFLGWCYQKVQGRTQEISQVELKGIGLSMNKAPITVFTLKSRRRHHRFGSFLTEPEKAWLMAQVKDFLEKQYTLDKLEASNKSEV